MCASRVFYVQCKMQPVVGKPMISYSWQNIPQNFENFQNRRFIRLMCEWYYNFGKCVSMRQLKMVGRQVATKMGMDQLPSNWISTLRKKHGITLVPYRKRRYSKPIKISELPPEKKNYALPNPTSSTNTRHKHQSRGKQIYEQPLFFEKKDESRFNPTTGVSNLSSKSTNTVDMTLLPPPKQWRQAAKGGKVLSRIKRKTFKEGKKILFYEYQQNSKSKDSNYSKRQNVDRSNASRCDSLCCA